MRQAIEAGSVLDHIPTGIFILDEGGNYLYANEEYCESVEKSAAYFKNMSIPKLKKMGYLKTSVWEQVIQERKSVISIVSITNENGVKPMLTVSTPQFDEKGNIKQIICWQESIGKLNRLLRVGAMNRHQFGRSTGADIAADERIIAESPQMKQLISTLLAVSKTDASILVTGPSGSGKEVLSQMIHRHSTYSGGPLVALNCAAIPESLFESELFGYERGAFTGATSGGKKGLIESANGGTLFLDEINSMPLSFQIKLLRVLETKQVTRLGSVNAQKVDFRLVCASNEDLHTLVEERRFRSDLFYRINVISVSIPPLNERKQDIIPLAIYFVELFCKKYNYIKVLSETAVERLKSYAWPGNVRELRNVIERAVVMSPEQEWEISDIPIEQYEQTERNTLAGVRTSKQIPQISIDGLSLKGYMNQCEKKLFEELLEEKCSPKQMADRLKINLSSVYRKLQSHGLGLQRIRG